jgi:hypothetical protein
MIKTLLLTAALLVGYAQAANAMSGLEFLKVYDNNVAVEAKVMQDCVIRFVEQGYHNVPDWAHLSRLTADLIRKKGYRDADINTIAEEAAITDGMTK